MDTPLGSDYQRACHMVTMVESLGAEWFKSGGRRTKRRPDILKFILFISSLHYNVL